MINRINKYLNKILNEEFAGYVDSDRSEEIVPVEKNITYSEFRKLLKKASYETLRVLLDKEGNNFYVWDADKALHSDVEYDLNINYPYKLIIYKNDVGNSLIADLEDIYSREEAKEFLYNEEHITFSELPFVKKFNIKNVYLYPEISFNTDTMKYNIKEQEDSFLRKAGNKLGREAAGLAGDVATGVLRGFSPIPAIAGLSKIAGETISNELVDYFDKLFGTKKYLKNKVRNNEYYDKNYYNKYGYNIPEIELPSQEYDRIKEYIIPALKKFGYKMKVVGTSREDKSYLIILFPGNSIYPNMDTNRNPIIYPIPIDIFNKIINKESSFVVVYDLLKLFDVQIRSL